MSERERILESGLRIAVLCGGSGSEREISLVSGRSVAQALHESAIPCDCFELAGNYLPAGLDPERHLVLPLVHGKYGEGGRLSAELELSGFVYAGSNMASSVLCFDKLACKTIAARMGIPVARDYLLHDGEMIDYASIAGELGSSFILKPRFDGSSVGLYLIHSEKDFSAAFTDLGGQDYLAETFIDGFDLSLGILGEDVLGSVGIYPAGGLYDYDHKYTLGMTRYEVPARMDEGQRQGLAKWSMDLFTACGCQDIARLDFRMGHDGALVFLELNTLPGMTSTSLVPKMASLAGLDFGGLILRWVGFALDRVGERSLSAS